MDDRSSVIDVEPASRRRTRSSVCKRWAMVLEETEAALREHMGEEAVFRFRNHDGLPQPDLTEIGRRPESDWARLVHYGRLRISELQRELGYPQIAPKRPIEL